MLVPSSLSPLARFSFGGEASSPMGALEVVTVEQQLGRDVVEREDGAVDDRAQERQQPKWPGKA